LRAVLTTGVGPHPFRIWMRPKADGIDDFTYTDYSDWNVLRKNLCKWTVYPTLNGPRPISCPLP